MYLYSVFCINLVYKLMWTVAQWTDILHTEMYTERNCAVHRVKESLLA